MCTAIACGEKDFYFGRTLDYDVSFGEEVILTPRNFLLPFRHTQAQTRHYAILGMARELDGYPLYFDGINEKGLAMAGLNFVGYARYEEPNPDRINVAQFEFLPWILGQCASVSEARGLLAKLCLTGTRFRSDVPAAQLHWLLADRKEAVTIEAGKEGLRIWDNPVGVLTNNPAFDDQLLRLNDFMQLSPGEPENRFSDKLELKPYSRGMGAVGLPGDFSSQSRFVRAAFVKLNSVSGRSEADRISQFFHILETVSQPRGCCRLGEGRYEITRYTACCNADKGIYSYTTYENRRITAVDMHRCDLEGAQLVRFPLVREEQILWQN